MGEIRLKGKGAIGFNKYCSSQIKTLHCIESESTVTNQYNGRHQFLSSATHTHQVLRRVLCCGLDFFLHLLVRAATLDQVHPGVITKTLRQKHLK